MSHWEAYKSKHNKTYSNPEEDEQRRAIFEGNLVKIEEHNEKFKKGEVTWEMGINQFSDLTDEERKMRTGGLAKPKN